MARFRSVILSALASAACSLSSLDDLKTNAGTDASAGGDDGGAGVGSGGVSTGGTGGGGSPGGGGSSAGSGGTGGVGSSGAGGAGAGGAGGVGAGDTGGTSAGGAGAGGTAAGGSSGGGSGGTTTCTPKTCSQLGHGCGSVDDGCGKQLACGKCAGAESCVASMGGASCQLSFVTQCGGCPSGYQWVGTGIPDATCGGSGPCPQYNSKLMCVRTGVSHLEYCGPGQCPMGKHVGGSLYYCVAGNDCVSCIAD